MSEIDALIARRERLLRNGKNPETSGIINKINRKIRKLEREQNK